jgi:hypothetical protein
LLYRSVPRDCPIGVRLPTNSAATRPYKLWASASRPPARSERESELVGACRLRTRPRAFDDRAREFVRGIDSDMARRRGDADARPAGSGKDGLCDSRGVDSVHASGEHIENNKARLQRSAIIAPAQGASTAHTWLRDRLPQNGSRPLSDVWTERRSVTNASPTGSISFLLRRPVPQRGRLAAFAGSNFLRHRADCAASRGTSFAIRAEPSGRRRIQRGSIERSLAPAGGAKDRTSSGAAQRTWLAVLAGGGRAPDPRARRPAAGSPRARLLSALRAATCRFGLSGHLNRPGVGIRGG